MTAGRKSRRRGRITVTPDAINLECVCGVTRQISRAGEDTDRTLDREAPGWWTCTNGLALCPNCVIKKGKRIEPGPSHRVHGGRTW